MLRARASAAVLAVLTLTCVARAAPPALRVILTDRAGVVKVDDIETPLEKLTDIVKAAQAPVTTLALGHGGELPARAVLIAIDRCLKGGKPVRAVWPQTKGQYTFERTPLAPDEWLADAPGVDEVCDGALPPDFAVSGDDALLEVDLRGQLALSGTGKERVLRSAPLSLLDAKIAGEPGPSATVALAVGAEPTAIELYQLLRFLGEKECGRVLLLAKSGDVAGGLLLSLAPDSDRPGPLTRRAKPPTGKGVPAYRAMRLLCEEALLALRMSARPDGSLPGDVDFTDAEASALGLLAFLNVGVRAGDGTRNGQCVLGLTKYLSGWPYDKARHVRRERTLVAAALLEAAAKTRHPLLIPQAKSALAAIAKELATDTQIREGVDKGFEAVGLLAARQLELPGHLEAEAKLRALLESTVDPEGVVLNNWSTRNSIEMLAFAYGFAALEWAPVASPRVAALVAQAPPEFPATDSPLPHASRAFGIFFQSRVALLAGGAAWKSFDLGLKSSLPKTPPQDDFDFEERTADQVHCPWSGGGGMHSAGRVALMTLAYDAPDHVGSKAAKTK